MKIDNVSSALSGALHSKAPQQVQSGFSDLLEGFIADVNADLKEAGKAQEKLMSGEVDNMIELMSTIEKADISLRFATEIRNKALEAYQDIMRMQV